MAMTVAHPQLITQIVRYESDGVERKFLYYQTDQVIIEHTMPSATQYRFAAIPNTSAFIQRISFIVSESGSAFPHDPVYQIQVTQDHFLRIKKLVEAGQTTQALEELLVQGASNDSARAFVSAMERPLTNSTVAFMRSEDERIVDGREIVFLRSYTSAWVIYQKKPGDSNLLVETVSMMNLEEKVLDRFLSLVQPVEDVE